MKPQPFVIAVSILFAISMAGCDSEFGSHNLDLIRSMEHMQFYLEAPYPNPF